MLVDDRDPLIVHGENKGVAKLAERDHRPDVRCSVFGIRGSVFGSVLGLRVLASGFQRGYDRASAAQRLATVAPPRTPGIAIAVGSPGRGANEVNLQFRGLALPQRVAEAAAQDFVDERLLEEAHLRLRRMNVYVDAVRGISMKRCIRLRSLIVATL